VGAQGVGRCIALTVLLLASCAEERPPEDEVGRVTRRITGSEDWTRDLDRCPAELMPARQQLDYLKARDCAPGAFETCFERCRDGEAGPCYWLAVALQETDASRDAIEALFLRACKLGIVSGCTNRAAGMTLGGASPEADACATATFARACASDDPWACTMVASRLSDRDEALRALEKACRNGPDDPACKAALGVKAKILGGPG
jgi:hypothetical protein